jgi:hypothetical protein
LSGEDGRCCPHRKAHRRFNYLIFKDFVAENSNSAFCRRLRHVVVTARRAKRPCNSGTSDLRPGIGKDACAGTSRPFAEARVDAAWQTSPMASMLIASAIGAGIRSPPARVRQRIPSGPSVTPTGAGTARKITLNPASVRIFRGCVPPSDPGRDRTGRPTREFERGPGQTSPSSPLIRPRCTAHGMLRRAEPIIAHGPASRGKRRLLSTKARSDRIRRWRRCRDKPAVVRGIEQDGGRRTYLPGITEPCGDRGIEWRSAQERPTEVAGGDSGCPGAPGRGRSTWNTPVAEEATRAATVPRETSLDCARPPTRGRR